MKGKGGLLCIKSYQYATYSAQSEDERDGEKTASLWLFFIYEVDE